MTVLYVASDRPGAGKTALSVSLAHRWASRGKSAFVVKPVAEGDRSGEDSDLLTYQSLLGQEEASIYSSLSAQISDSDLKSLSEDVAQIASANDVVIVEAPDGYSPSDHARIANALSAKVVVVASYSRELRGDALMPWKSAIENALAGFVVNGRTRYTGHECSTLLAPSMEQVGLTLLGVVPEDRTLLGVTVGQLAEHLEGDLIVNEEKSDALVERFMAWGFSLDPGELTFRLRPDNALVVRGDRPDIQMSALATSMTCIICTEGLKPLEYIMHEAEDEGTVLLLVEPDTLDVMDRLGSIQSMARFDHPRKLARFAELLEAHVDVSAIEKALEIV